MSAKESLLDKAAIQGWTQDTMLSVVTDFIDEHDLKHSFIDYLQYRAEEEELSKG